MTKTPATEEMNCCHELKTDPHVFDAVVRGEKTYEIRFNDRDYKVGDNLFLRRTKFDGEGMKKFGAPLIYTGETITVKITHILQGQYGLQDGWAILSFIPAKALDASETVDLDALKRESFAFYDKKHNIKALEEAIEAPFPTTSDQAIMRSAARAHLQSLKAGNKQIMSADEFVLWAVKNGYGDFIKTSTRL
jgi:hypothetical protein